MPKAVDEAVELFELNRDMLGLRLELLQQEVITGKRGSGLLNAMQQLSRRRRDRRWRLAIVQTALRKREYEQAIQCLHQGEADLAVILLRQMLGEVGRTATRKWLWRRWRAEDDLLQPARPITGTSSNEIADYYRVSNIYMNLLNIMG